MQNIISIDKRILDLDTPAEELIASDQKRLVVDALPVIALSTRFNSIKRFEMSAGRNPRLSTIVSSSMRSVLGEEKFETVVRDERSQLMQRISALVNKQAADFGIEIIDVRIRRADLPEANSQAIYRRMQTEREQEAAEFRARGQEVARAIRAQATSKSRFCLRRQRATVKLLAVRAMVAVTAFSPKYLVKTLIFLPSIAQCKLTKRLLRKTAPQWCCRRIVHFFSS